MSDRSPTLSEVLARAVERGLACTRVALPAKIEKFDAATQLAAVQPLLKESFEEEDGSETVYDLGVLNNVPVQFPGGSDFVVTFPVAVGDPCWLVFSDRSLEVWKEKGGIVDPIDLRRHHLSDACAVLGVRSKAGALAEFDTGAMRLGKVGGVGIRIKAGEVHLGVAHNADAANFVALANLVDQNFNALKTALTSWTPVPNDGGSALKVILTALFGPPANWPAGTAATKVKAT